MWNFVGMLVSGSTFHPDKLWHCHTPFGRIAIVHTFKVLASTGSLLKSTLQYFCAHVLECNIVQYILSLANIEMQHIS